MRVRPVGRDDLGGNDLPWRARFACMIGAVDEWILSTSVFQHDRVVLAGVAAAARGGESVGVPDVVFATDTGICVWIAVVILCSRGWVDGRSVGAHRDSERSGLAPVGCRPGVVVDSARTGGASGGLVDDRRTGGSAVDDLRFAARDRSSASRWADGRPGGC